eukprot:TRINITY_DN23665_c0_g1_i1.p3 TRINITY_DN23665_c0_g1~~TRINITY_DN23665_c0_g1_i1.p3  ORF type:complete len:187 (+),score=13.83 TRINITY_DN23665_c0_g1_i1:104-664(+)
MKKATIQFNSKCTLSNQQKNQMLLLVRPHCYQQYLVTIQLMIVVIKFYVKILNTEVQQVQKVSRPDVCWPVNQLSRVQENAKETHWNRVERVAKFLNGTKNDFLKIDCTDCTSITVFTDASFGCDNSTGKSTTGYAVFIGNGLISWGTKKQKTVSLSTTEAELVALCKGIQEGQYLRTLFSWSSAF